MTKKKAKIIKVKVKPVASQKTNIESQEISKVTLSAELLKEIIYMVFLFLALICVFANTGGIYFILSNYSNLIYRVLIISNSLLIVAQIIMTIIYSFILKSNKLKKTLLSFLGNKRKNKQTG